MNHYFLIRRLRGPAFLLLIGTMALLNQADVLSWGKSWPLLLILAGVLALAERAALATGGGHPPAPQNGVPAPGATPETHAIVPAHPREYDGERNGGQQ